MDSLAILSRTRSEGGVSIVHCAHTLPVRPRQRESSSYYPDRVRFSRTHYPGLGKGSSTRWSGDGREVTFGLTTSMRRAWTPASAYPRACIGRLAGVWPTGTSGGIHGIQVTLFRARVWNFCYMMTRSPARSRTNLTAMSRPLKAGHLACDMIRQRFELYTESVLAGQPILVLHRNSSINLTESGSRRPEVSNSYETDFEHVKAIRAQTHQSWTNIRKASRLLQGKDYEAFGTRNVENGAKVLCPQN